MAVRFYWIWLSHPSQAVRKMLDLKGVEYRQVDVRPLNQRFHLRLAGFRGGTVPALVVDGQRIQGSRQIARAVEARWPAPPLFPADPTLRRQVEEAERWGEEQLQPIPRRLFRYGLWKDKQFRRTVVEGQRLPAPALLSAAISPLIWWYARTVEADGQRATEETARADLAALPSHLARVDRLLADGTLTVEQPNAATLQILATVALLTWFADLKPLLGERPCAAAARAIFPDYRGTVPPFLEPTWLPVPEAA